VGEREREREANWEDTYTQMANHEKKGNKSTAKLSAPFDRFMRERIK